MSRPTPARPGPHVIGLIGESGAGKDTLASFLAPHGYARVAFADSLRDVAELINPYVASHGFGGGMLRLRDVIDTQGWDDAKRNSDEIRRLLQAIGGGVRSIAPNVWIDAAKDRIADVMVDGKHVVISDVSYPAEIDLVHALGGFVVRVDRAGVGLTGGLAGHESERNRATLNADLVVRNDRGVEFLAHEARTLATFASSREHYVKAAAA